MSNQPTTQIIQHDELDSAQAHDLIIAWYDKVSEKGETYANNSEILAKETVLDLLAKGTGTIFYGRKKDDLARVDRNGNIPENRKLFFQAVCGYAYLWNIRLDMRFIEQMENGAQIDYVAIDDNPNQNRTINQQFEWKYGKKPVEEVAAAIEAEDEDETLTPEQMLDGLRKLTGPIEADELADLPGDAIVIPE